MGMRKLQMTPPAGEVAGRSPAPAAAAAAAIARTGEEARAPHDVRASSACPAAAQTASTAHTGKPSAGYVEALL
eukprot:CAMPEP_0182864290 /NCGR_PEP_ID=MMETSP0034_2-20130328/7094_1 /TAXON_ID=156128 /ORGANISM="Nephroselmis pyriformis, Strain CCMP717" /LENGTH=73 /DNA_ID=CAMNT_0024996545 /DNA_START=486 /DNA_END=704 /DNA_ORIENTATION=+